MLFVACNKSEPIDEPGGVDSPAPPFLDILGHVTNESGQPLLGIRMEAVFEKPEDWYGYASPTYTNTDGEYWTMYEYWGIEFEWEPIKRYPDEITIAATDTSGVYAPQSQIFPVEVRRRYQGMNIYDGHVNADFVLSLKQD